MSVTTEAATTRPPEDLLAGYKPPPGIFDEMFDEAGLVRPAKVSDRARRRVEQTGAEGIARQTEQARRLLRDNGVTYNVYGETSGEERPWELDCVPMLISSKEWNGIAEGLTQRAALLNLLLVDLYGRQDLLRQGMLPAELVLGNPEYLLPCRDVRVPNDCYLHLYAAHLGRGPDGNWTVLADRTQGPSGAGYALENRLVVSRVLAEEFHDARVRRHATFFKSLRDSLFSSATRHRENPRVVLLTPGPSSSAYFEDVYLARYLGYTLVEGGDLTVGDNAVFLKTLGGLLPVDVILRRLQDTECDPLELRTESMFGVAGLLQAARSGNVVIANALGSGILEAPALAAFLPELCRRMLGEELAPFRANLVVRSRRRSSLRARPFARTRHQALDAAPHATTDIRRGSFRSTTANDSRRPSKSIRTTTRRARRTFVDPGLEQRQPAAAARGFANLRRRRRGKIRRHAGRTDPRYHRSLPAGGFDVVGAGK